MINLEIKRAQNLDIATLLHAAISRAQKGSKKRTGEQNRKRVVRAVNAVINTVMAGDRSQGAKLAAKAMKGADSAPDKKAAGSVKVSKLQDEIRRLRKDRIKITTNKKREYKPAPPKPPPSRKMAA